MAAFQSSSGGLSHSKISNVKSNLSWKIRKVTSTCKSKRSVTVTRSNKHPIISNAAAEVLSDTNPMPHSKLKFKSLPNSTSKSECRHTPLSILSWMPLLELLTTIKRDITRLWDSQVPGCKKVQCPLPLVGLSDYAHWACVFPLRCVAWNSSLMACPDCYPQLLVAPHPEDVFKKAKSKSHWSQSTWNLNVIWIVKKNLKQLSSFGKKQIHLEDTPIENMCHYLIRFHRKTPRAQARLKLSASRILSPKLWDPPWTTWRWPCFHQTIDKTDSTE